jgi:malonyl-CoA O-methyltransferase
MSTIAARAGYRLWAPHYEAETAISHLENLVVGEMGVATAHKRLLDVGCGTARRIRGSGARLAIGVDLTFEMFDAAAREHLLSAGDVRALPFASSAFDVVWCRLLIGHIAALEIAYAELSRVCRNGGTIVVSDVCPDAIAAGHRRRFRDSSGIEHELEHHVHTPAAHGRAAGHAGLEMIATCDGVVGESIKPFYDRAGRPEAYQEQVGLPLVRVTSWRKVERAL